MVRFFGTVLALTLVMAPVGRGQTAPAPLHSWERVQGLAPGARLRISAKPGGGSCVLESVSAQGLVCRHGASTRTVLRADIKSVKYASRGRSAGIGLLVGLGVGAGIGAGVGSAINSGDSGSLLHVSGQKSAGVGAAIGAAIGGIGGALIGSSQDLFAGAVIYRR